MPTLTIRNVPPALYKQLKSLATKHKRSLQQQALVLLQAAEAFDKSLPSERIAALRAQFKGRDLGDLVEDVRAERAR